MGVPSPLCQAFLLRDWSTVIRMLDAMDVPLFLLEHNECELACDSVCEGGGGDSTPFRYELFSYTSDLKIKCSKRGSNRETLMLKLSSAWDVRYRLFPPSSVFSLPHDMEACDRKRCTF